MNFVPHSHYYYQDVDQSYGQYGEYSEYMYPDRGQGELYTPGAQAEYYMPSGFDAGYPQYQYGTEHMAQNVHIITAYSAPAPTPVQQASRFNLDDYSSDDSDGEPPVKTISVKEPTKLASAKAVEVIAASGTQAVMEPAAEPSPKASSEVPVDEAAPSDEAKVEAEEG